MQHFVAEVRNEMSEIETLARLKVLFAEVVRTGNRANVEVIVHTHKEKNNDTTVPDMVR